MIINNFTLSHSRPRRILLILLLLQGCNSAVEDINNSYKVDGNNLENCSTPIARYYFNERPDSTIVYDSSSLEPPANLIVQDSSAVSFLSSGLEVFSSTKLNSDRSQNTSDKIISALRSSNALTAELWITPANDTQSGPARIVSISADYYNRDFTIGQSGDQYILRLRTSTTNANGKISASLGDVNPLITDPGTVRLELTHLVLTWDSESATARYFINGALSASTALEGDLSTWSDGYPMLLANELLYNRAWLGKYYYLAIYDCAMQESHIADNFSNGVPAAN